LVLVVLVVVVVVVLVEVSLVGHLSLDSAHPLPLQRLVRHNSNHNHK
jgi:hypothetical protein